MSIRIQLRRGTTTQWSTANPVLADGEIGLDTTLDKFKIGDGTTTWNSLSFSGLTQSDLASYATTTSLSNHESDTTNIHGISDTANLATQTYVDTAVSTHSSDTTNIHGITDTSNIVLTNDSRLTDSRTPTSHAASHGSAGSDSITIAQSQVTNLTTDLSAKANLDSPTLTGTPSAPTAAAATNTTQIATTAFVRTEVSNLVAAAPTALDTLNELATALGNDANFATTISNSLGNKQPLDADLTAIAGLTGSTGFLKKTAADTWSLDTSTYLTANQTITLSGDVSGSGTTSIEVTIADDSHNHIISNVDGLQTALDGKEPTITSGTTSQYWRGDKSWQTLDKSAVGLDNVENTALSTWAGSSNITTVGTIGSGTWQGSSISSTYIDSAIARLSSPTFTGTPAAPTAAADTNSTQIATTGFVIGQGYAKLSSPTFTGTVVIPVSTNVQTSSYTLVLSDASKLIEMNVASGNTVTVPPNSSVAFPIGTKIDIVQTGAGETSIAPGAGVTLNSDTNKRKINVQWAAVSLVKRAENTWVLIGALKA